MPKSSLIEQIWSSVDNLNSRVQAVQSELIDLHKLLAIYDPDAHWVNPRGVARLYSNTTADDIRLAVEGRVREVDDNGHLLISGPIWSSISDRPALRPDLLASADQARAAREHRIVRSTNVAARYLGVPARELTAAAFTNALRDENDEPVEMLLDEEGGYLWRHCDLMRLAKMIDDGSLDQHVEDAAARGTEFGINDI
ncbi:hypothetical protein BFL43_01985 [Williamsia sp. 1135]|nr:hypothetical protein BFL43_01985 [Williamsia sp. 1135]